MLKKTKSFILLVLLLSTTILVGCNKQEKEIENKPTVKSEEEPQTIVDDIQFTVDLVEKKVDYENKETIVMSVTYKNLSKENIIIDSQDVTVTQGGYLLKTTYDESLQTTAYYIEIEPGDSKTFKIGYRLEGDSTDIKLTFKPFLSKKKLQLNLNL